MQWGCVCGLCVRWCDASTVTGHPGPPQSSEQWQQSRDQPDLHQLHWYSQHHPCDAQILLWSVTSVRRLLCLSHSKPHRYDSHVLSAFFSGRSHDVPWSARHVRYILLYPCRRGSDSAQYLPTSPRRDAHVPHTSPRLRSGRRSQCVLMSRFKMHG